jgi:FemAB-related protein (PEP-CTERM system-associated)
MNETVAVHGQSLPDDWDAYVRGHAQGTWYHQSRWKRLIEDTFGHRSHYLSATRAERLVGVLPLSQVSSWAFGRMLVSGAYGCYGGVCADDAAATEALLRVAKDRARELGVDYLELRCIEALDDAQLQLKTFKETFWLDLPSDMDTLLKSYRTKFRNRARRAAVVGCVIRMGGEELVNDFFDVYCRRMRELGTPTYGKNLFDNLLRIYADDVRIIALQRDGRVIGAGVMVFDGESVEVPWLAALGSELKIYPNNAIYLEAIQHAIQRGCRRFDFGTSNAGSGNATFKARWGAQRIQLHWQYYPVCKPGVPDLSPHNRKFSLAIRTWRRLPLWLTNRLGPQIMRRIP